MNKQNYRQTDAALPLLKAVIVLLCLAPFQLSAADWEYTGEVYIWGAAMDMTTPGGQQAELPFSQILSDLNMTFMGDFSAQNEKWSLTTDLIYLDMEQKKERDSSFPNLGGVPTTGRVSMTSWIITPTVGYAFYNTDKARFEIIGGARYLDIDVGIKISRNGMVDFNESSSKGFWDGIIGLRSTINLNEKWYLPMYFDVGGGDSDGTWQAQAGIGYRFSKIDTSLTYRYLDYQFDDLKALSDLTVKGLVLGFAYTW